DGPIALSNAKLSGFDLGAKLGAVGALAGLPHVGDTVVQSLTGTLQMTPQGIHVAALSLVVPSIGTMTGDGSISPQGAMDFAMLAKLREGAVPAATGTVARVLAYGETNGVPFRVEGTTSNPSFVPDLRRAAQGAVDSLKKAAQNPDTLKKAADALSGIFGRKPQ
ncbi:MAG TPA: hypothetical protein VG871_22500, partial [Vicinamibacterales bacterium]|nr:hypothetical protein [Vicinamibacterales bacterium]